MGKYILRRLAQSLVVLFGVSILAFAVLFLSGDATHLYVNEHASAETIAQTRHAPGFDRPIYIQYVSFPSKAIRGDCWLPFGAIRSLMAGPCSSPCSGSPCPVSGWGSC